MIPTAQEPPGAVQPDSAEVAAALADAAWRVLREDGVEGLLPRDAPGGVPGLRVEAADAVSVRVRALGTGNTDCDLICDADRVLTLAGWSLTGWQWPPADLPGVTGGFTAQRPAD